MTRLLIGCGYLGQRIVAAWRERPGDVFVTTRSRDRATEWQAQGLRPVVCDVLDQASLSQLPAADEVVYCVGLDRSAGVPMRQVYVEGLANVLRALPRVGRLVYVSSTSVYGGTAGDWVDEDTPTDPLEESGRVVLEAESELRRLRPDAVILRFAGIYGPGRLLRERDIRAGAPLAIDPEKWLNLIHVADGARAVLAALEGGVPGAVYNVADDQPSTRREYYGNLAALLQAPTPNYLAPQNPERINRRVRNLKMRSELGVDLVFPDHRRGLQDAVLG